jgi:hypothetical protein
MIEYLLRRLTHGLMITTWIAGCFLAWLWYRPVGVALLGVGIALFWWALKRGAFTVSRSKATEGVTTEREAKYMVTQVLRNLTRVQVSYLCQDFSSRAQSRAWLKQTLPRTFHSLLDELHHNLENARMGSEVPALRLARAILALRDRVLGLDGALASAKQDHPTAAIAHPVIFVVTEHLDVENAEPQVITLAGWDSSAPALLPRVDVLTFLSESDGGKLVRGQASFDAAVAALSQFIQPCDDEKTVYAAQAVADPAQHGVQLDKVPLGFVIGAAELL